MLLSPQILKMYSLVFHPARMFSIGSIVACNIQYFLDL